MKKILLLVLLLLCWTLVGCSHIDDTNGPDDYSLQVITDNDIIKGYNTIKFGSVATSMELGGIVKNNLDVKKFSGVETIRKIVGNDNVTVTIENTCSFGNFKVVIIHNDQIIHTIEANSEATFNLSASNEPYILKIAGETARFHLVYSIVSE